MRYSIAAVAMSLALSALADVAPPLSIVDLERPVAAPPPGSACLNGPDKYPKRDLAPPIIVENQRRSLGITSLPRQWTRDLLGHMRDRAEHAAADDSCRQLQCACVRAGKKTPYGVYNMSQCPLQHGAAYEQCSIVQDGYQCVFPCSYESLARECFTDEKCEAKFPGTTALCYTLRWST